MSDPILPLAVWEESTLQNDVPANDNSLRLEALSREVLGVANSPASTYDGAVYIVGAAPSGDFATFDPNDLTIYRGGNWYAWAPVDGIVVYIGTDPYQYSGSSGWTDIGGGTGAVSSVNGQTGVVSLALDDLDDVNAAAPSDGDVLTWDSGANEWVPDTASASVAWGGITGTLSDQTDLQTALDAKAPLSVTQNSQSAAYTLVLSDAGKHIYHPSADTTARIWTIPANSSVAFPIGTVVTFVNDNGAGVITIAITSDTLRLAGAGTTGSRTLAANGIATAIKMTSTSWQINGTGLT